MGVKRPNITIVGCGPGSLDYITLAALKAVSGAEVLVGVRRLLDLFPDHRARTVIEMKTRVEPVLEEMAAQQDRSLVVLVSGDPGLSSLARPVIERFGRKSCQIIPGISSIQVAFARLGLDWGGARIIDAHGQDPKFDLKEMLTSGLKKMAVLGGRQGSLDWLARGLQGAGADWVVYALENLTLEDERVRALKPGDLRKIKVSSRTIFLVIKNYEVLTKIKNR